jgi:hypothetical protein
MKVLASKISDSSTPTMSKQSQIIKFSGGHWTAAFRALPEPGEFI